MLSTLALPRRRCRRAQAGSPSDFHLVSNLSSPKRFLATLWPICDSLELLEMVCKKCEAKTSKLAAPDPFASSSSAIKSGSRKVGDNKLLRKAGGGKANVCEPSS